MHRLLEIFLASSWKFLKILQKTPKSTLIPLNIPTRLTPPPAPSHSFSIELQLDSLSRMIYVGNNLENRMKAVLLGKRLNKELMYEVFRIKVKSY